MAEYAEYYDYLTGSGVIVPDTSNILSDVQQEWRDVFGSNLSVEPETPQGRIIELIARQRVFTLQAIAATSNMLNIDKAYGFVLDDIGSLFQIQRKAATYTTVTITMMGVVGTIIPVGTELRSDDGDIFVNDEEFIIGDTGRVSGTFRAEVPGIINVSVNSISSIVSSVPGLESVNNDADATIGEEQEGDTEFRNRIKDSLNINSMAALTAITSAVANIDNVIQVKGYENTTNTAVILDTDFTLPAHSIALVVDYNETDITNQDVATEIAGAIYKKKTLGAGYIAAETTEGEDYIVEINYNDENDGSEHKVVFAKPKERSIACTINVLRKNYSGDDLVGDIKNAIAQFLDGNNPEVDRVAIGGSLSPFEIAAAISSSVPDIFIESVTIGDVGDTQSTSVITLGEATKLVIESSNITVNVVA